jgi:aquaporin NIP
LTTVLGSALVAEAIGTFVLVFAGCGAIASGSLGEVGVAAAFGLAIMTMVYAFRAMSGAHLNPAVTLAMAIDGRLETRRIPAYWLAQVGGAILAAAFLRATLGDGAPLGVTEPSGSVGQALIWEIALTFVLMSVIAATATDPRATNLGAGAAIGAAVALGSLVGGPVTGASMNPARSIGPAVVSGDLANLWIYLLAPPIGAAVAIVVNRSLRSTHGRGIVPCHWSRPPDHRP